MCDKCNKNQIVEVRNCNTDICEEYDCATCKGCMAENNFFSIDFNKYGDKTYISVYYEINSNALEYYANSKGLEIKYCPFCGAKL